MKLYVVISQDRQVGNLVSLISESRIECHPFIYPEDVQLQLCYHFPVVKFEELPEPLRRDNIFPFSNDFRNSWYHVNSLPE